MLTGKALEYFNEWRWECMGQIEFDLLPKSLQYALVIEWFDSVKINICVDRWSLKFWSSNVYTPYRNNLGIEFENRKYAIEKAITKANEIYNNMSYVN